MRDKRVHLAVVGSLAACLLGCTSGAPSVRPERPVEAPGDAQAAHRRGHQDAPAAVVVLPEGEGDFELDLPFRHKPSGVHFPLRIGPFERAGGHRYSDRVDDFSFLYFTPELDESLRVSVYVYPIKEDVTVATEKQRINFLLEQMQGVMGGIRSQYDDVEVVEAIAGELPIRDRALLWGMAEVTFVSREAPPEAKTSWSYVAAHGPWFVKLRMTAPTARIEQARQLQAAFARELSALIEEPEGRDR